MSATSDLVSKFSQYVINPAILIVFSFGFFLFIWGLVVFLWSLGEGGESGTGKQHMLWGIVGMLVMVSVWGIIGLIENTFGIGNAGGTDASSMNSVTAPVNFTSQ
jgi:hypothetical protein